MHPEIEKLIKLAMANGELTEKKREIILRKAENLGEDKDEVEMIIDGEIALAKQEKIVNQTISQIKSNKEGNLKKCPSCGAPVPSLSLKCSECGHEFRNTEATQSAKDFYKHLKSAKIEERATIISDYPIPNNKEDLIEFISISVGNSRELSIEERNSYVINVWNGKKNPQITMRDNEIKAWQGKAEAAIMKAKLLFSDNSSILQHLKKFEEQFEENRTHVQKAQNKKTKTSGTIMLLMMLIFIVYGIIMMMLNHK